MPAGVESPESIEAWMQQRREILRDWGRKREAKMHRKPRCLMDQMVSGSGLYPIRLLDSAWFTPRERAMISQLEAILQDTGHAHTLAYDMLTPLIYDIEVAIVLDNSGSMNLDMLGQVPPAGSIEVESGMRPGLLDRVLKRSLPGGWFSWASSRALPVAQSPISPYHRRWFFARQHLRRWKQVFEVMGLDPWVYLLNSGALGARCRCSQVEQIFRESPRGRTPMDATLKEVLDDLAPGRTGKSLFILAMTDGEANDMNAFNQVLDRIQNMVYGDVQVCLVGLSLVQEDIEWFEQEECEDTRIRTIEAFEVENRQIQLKEVMKQEGGYTFGMHVMRALVTNYYPADYDYETPLQNLRHRLYITVHGRDRWWAQNNILWSACCTSCLCPACFLATGCHCCGWLQGNDCGKYELPQCLEPCFKE